MGASVLHFHLCFRSSSPKLHLRNPKVLPFLSIPNKLSLKQPENRFRVLRSNYSGWDRKGYVLGCCFCKAKSDTEIVPVEEERPQPERPPFDIHLAVILAGFAFEAYSSPPENVGRREVDAVDCQTVFLSESFVREVYDGQLFVKLKNGVNFPAMDPWGTSDPYVVLQLDGQVVKSKVKWATKDPTWNEDFTLNIKMPALKNLQVAAWDANLVTPHKRMGNAGINLESLCDGNLHEVLVELEGLGGGGRIYLEVKYRSFDEIDAGKQSWRIPYISDLLEGNSFASSLENFFGTDTVKAQEFVQYAFGKLRSFNYLYEDKVSEENSDSGSDMPVNAVGSSEVILEQKNIPDGALNELGSKEDNILEYHEESTSGGDGLNASPDVGVDESGQLEKYFWKDLADVISSTVAQKLGFPIPEKLKFDEFDLLNTFGLQSKQIAEAGYVESGLATSESQDADATSDLSDAVNDGQSSFPDIKNLSMDVLRQTDSIFGALMVLNTTGSQQNKDACSEENNEAEKINSEKVTSGNIVKNLDESSMDKRKAEEMKALFSSAESAMEAWAMLATSLGHPSFIKSEFEKICFLDNTSTDTQVAIWRDSMRQRLVIAFRGTEQVRWKDLRTDLMMVPAGLNPERISGDFKQEVQVHSGFLSAYDSVRTRLMSLIKLSTGYLDDGADIMSRWNIYVTGHSLGGALATLLALELSSSQMAKRGAISVTMYNFGSPRVGNKRFVDIYNEKVKDSWRIVNHRDIIPSVPRLMGYYHVAQPVYLATGDLSNALENMELIADGYQGDVIGEATPDVLVKEFMKGEKQLVEKILQTEINIFRSIRDGSALMQHMEDFYYIALLEHVKSNYKNIGNSISNAEVSI